MPGTIDAVDIPVREHHGIALDIGCDILFQCPVRHPVAGVVGPGDETAARRRTDAAGIGLGEHHTLTGKTFHVWSLVFVIVGCPLRPERHGCVLPAHVIHHEKDDVGMGGPGRGKAGDNSQGKRYESFFMHSRHVIQP